MILNYRKKSTIGYSTDFSYIALVGYFTLLMNMVAGYVDPYSAAGRVTNSDLILAICFFAISATQYTQTFIGPRRAAASLT